MDAPPNTDATFAKVRLVPELYFVPLDRVVEEKAHPHSQVREPNHNVPLVWAQSLKLLGDMIFDDLLQPEELDPLGRRLPLLRPGQTETVVQVVLLAEDAELQKALLADGLETQTVDQVHPITVCGPSRLRDAFTFIGIYT